MAVTTATAAPTRKWHQGVFVATLLLCLSSLPHYSCGQETATVVDDAAAAADVTDLGDVIGDAMGDLTELVEDLDAVIDEVSAEAEAEDPVVDAASDEAAADVDTSATTATESEDVESNASAEETAAPVATESSETEAEAEAEAPVVQSGPFIDIFGDVLLSLEMVDEAHAQVHQHYTNEALAGKKVVGLYFSADWCGPCKQFTPDLVNFYNKMNARKGKQNQFEIVWISRCRTVDAFGQYFTHMNWLALPPNEAMGERGQYLSDKYKVKGIPHLVLLDEIGNVITLDGRNKIPMDKAGVGFPWRSPMSVLISTLVPRSFRLLVKSQFAGVVGLVKGVMANALAR